jgi:electron transfer flavoprotein beta subunit
MKPLDIIVCMKPVPDPKRWDKLKLDPETMLLVRGNIPAVINQLDRNAIEQAVTLKAAHGGSISAITMAPPDGEDQLVEALSMGCDCAYLLCDRAFAGASPRRSGRSGVSISSSAAATRRTGARLRSGRSWRNSSAFPI